MPPDQTSPRVVVVAGATGHVGGAVARHLAAAGSRVVAPVRGAVAPGLEGAPAPAGLRVVPHVDWARPHVLHAVLDEPGWAPHAAVVALGGWWAGPDLVDLEPAAWSALLESHLTSHWLAARALAPRLTGADPAYVALGGAAAITAMAGSGPVSVTGAAQRMLLEVLRAEAIGARVRFHEVSVLAAVAGDDRNLDPESSVPLPRVTAAVARVLEDRASAPVVEVVGE